MLRAVRFAAKLDFSIETNTEAPIRELAYLLTHVPAARLFDETLKLFLSGFGTKSLQLLQRYHLLEPLFPKVGAILRRKPEGAEALLLHSGLESTDLRVTADKPVTPTFLFAILFYGPVIERAAQLQGNGQPEALALFNACEETVREQQTRVSIPRRFTLPMREMFTLQPRFRRREGKKALSLLHHPRFRAAYDLLLLRAKVGAEDAEIARWWTEVQSASAAEREAMVRPAGGAPHASGARRPVVAVVTGKVRRLREPLMVRWVPAYVALGSNLDGPRRQIEMALTRLAAIPRTRRVLELGLVLESPYGATGSARIRQCCGRHAHAVIGA